MTDGEREVMHEIEADARDTEEGLLPAPSDDGSCHCGAMVLATGSEPCPFCGGYTAAQMNVEVRRDDDGVPSALSDMIPW